MSAEEATLRGYVIGEEGKPVAGWVSLGLDQPQRWLAHTIRVETDEGYEVTVEELAGDSIVPVTKLDTKWGDIQHDEVAQLCYREAPAPDVDVQLRDAIIRGGDPVVVWGVVADHGYAGGEDTQSPAYRGGATRTISRLQARVVAYGENCEQFFTDAQLRWISKHAAPVVALPTAYAKVAASAPSPQASAPISERDYKNRLSLNTPLVLTLLALAGCVALAVVTKHPRPLLLSAAAACCIPIAFDTWMIGRFRTGHLPGPSLDIAIGAFGLSAVAAFMLGVGLALGDPDDMRTQGLRAFGYLFALGTVGSTAWLWFATRTRRQWVSILYRAPAHLEPLRDGVWGASDGTFSSEVMSIGEFVTQFGTAVKNAAGVKTKTVRTEKYANLTYEAELLTYNERKLRRVRLAEASILTMAHLERSMGGGKGVRADVITPKTPVRLVGRATNGVFVKSGVIVKAAEASLLVFASGVGTNVRQELGKLYVRDWIAQMFGVFAVVCVALAFLL
jgi:hypothetical protein